MPTLEPEVRVRIKGMEGPLPVESGEGPAILAETAVKNPTPSEVISTKPTAPSNTPAMLGDPIPFDIDTWAMDGFGKDPIEEIPEKRTSLAQVMGHFSRPFLAQGYNSAAALNRGLAALSAHLDAVTGYVAESTGMKAEGAFEQAAQLYTDNAEYWKKRADQIGIGFVDEIISEAIGGFAPGVSQFAFDVASGFTFPYMDGAYQAYKRGESPFEQGMVEAAKTGILAAVFHVMGPLKNYLKAPSMGTIFGLQEAETAPEGQKGKAFAKGMGIGLMYGATTPGGRMGLNEVAEAIKPEMQAFVRKMQDQTGAIGKQPESDIMKDMTRKGGKADIPAGKTPKAEGGKLDLLLQLEKDPTFKLFSQELDKAANVSQAVKSIAKQLNVSYQGALEIGDRYHQLIGNIPNSENFNKAILSQKSIIKNAQAIEKVKGTRVIGKDKKPLKVFHGTSLGYDEFFDTVPKDYSDRMVSVGGGTQWSDYENGPPSIHFTSSIDYAYNYSTHGGPRPEIKEAYINIKNPLTLDTDLLDLRFAGFGEDNVYHTLKSFVEVLDGADKKVANFVKNEWSDYGKKEFQGFEITSDPAFIEFIKDLGYDGIIAKENGYPVYAVFSPKQIALLSPNPTRPPESGGQVIPALVDSIKTKLKDQSGSTPIFNDIVELGRFLYSKGNTTFSKWSDSMKESFGESWEKIKPYAQQAWDDLKNERGEIRFAPGGEKPKIERPIDNLIEKRYSHILEAKYGPEWRTSEEFRTALAADRAGIETLLKAASAAELSKEPSFAGIPKEKIEEAVGKVLKGFNFETGTFTRPTPEASPQLSLVPKPGRKQRKFLKTVEESLDTDPELIELTNKIDPQDYLVQPNAQSRSIAENRIEKDGVDATVDWAKSDAPLSAEKGATFITLMEKFQREGNYDAAVDMVEAYDIQLREAGRFVQAASLWNKLSAPAFIRWANKQLESTRTKYGWADTIFKNKPDSFTLTKDEQKSIISLLREANELPDGLDKTSKTLEAIDIVAQKVPPSVSELIDDYRYQNMLSGPRTQFRNIGENVFNTFFTVPVDITTRGALDWVKAGLTGTEREAYVRDTPVYMKAVINSVPNAANAFMTAIRLGPGADITKPETGIQARGEFQRARAKQMPTALTLVKRFMEACDKFNMALIGAGEMAIHKKRGLSDVEAYRKGMEAAEIYLYRKQLDPNDPQLSYPSKVLASMGKMMQDSRKLPVLGPISKWYVPFITTPINKAVQMVERSPLGAIRDPKSFNEEAAAKILTGSIVTAVGAMLAYQGETTWAPPTNPQEKEWFYASGRKPFSIRINDTWIPIWYLGPFALPIGLAAATKSFTEDRSQTITQDGFEKLFATVDGLAQFVGSQTSTQSVGALFSALHGDIDFKFSSQTAFTAEQIIPASGFVRWTNTILDPVIRHPKGFIERLEADLPFLSERINARMTPLFEESRRESINYFLPYDIGTVKPVYETILPFERFKVRERIIENKMNQVIDKLKNKEITPEKSMELIMNLMQAGPKNIEQLGTELEKGGKK